MRWFKFVGDQKQAKMYGEPTPKLGKVYQEDAIIGKSYVLFWATKADRETINTEWQEVTDDELTVTLDTGHVSNTHDTVNHPAHYNQGEVECIEAIKSATINKTGIEAVCVGNVIKYLWRYEEKGGVESVKKAKWYLERLIKELEE